MTNYTVAINVNVPIEVKNQANEIFNKLGLNMSTAINMFLKRAIFERGIPFEVVLPEEKEDDLHQYFSEDELEQTAKELVVMEREPEKYKSYNNVNELFEDLDKDD